MALGPRRPDGVLLGLLELLLAAAEEGVAGVLVVQFGDLGD